MNEKLNVGFIGAGVISRLHAMGYVNNPHATLKSIADVKPDVARARAEEYGAAEWCTDYRELLSDPDLDAVEILLPHDLHLARHAGSAGRWQACIPAKAHDQDTGRSRPNRRGRG